jgi:hypothetical protein
MPRIIIQEKANKISVVIRPSTYIGQSEQHKTFKSAGNIGITKDYQKDKIKELNEQ